MCGICGVVDFDDIGRGETLVRQMTSAMVHRGPDAEGYLAAGPVSFGMRRLSIIDIEGGQQPIYNEDETVAAILNGEIYNFHELAKQLQSLGHHFQTRSDTEVIVHAYEEWGAECVSRLEGMFALAVWDGRKAEGRRQKAEDRGQGSQDRSERTGNRPTVFLARDRLGIKPLYYFAGKKSEVRSQEPEEDVRNNPTFSLAPDPRPPTPFFLFASEVRALLASGLVPRRLSRSALESYLLFGSIGEPMTLVDGVLSLPPGHTMTMSLGDECEIGEPQQYWTIASPPRNGYAANNGGGQIAVTQAHAAARVRELLEESVRKHLIADVPVGVFLSSGIDSTVLAALASREAGSVHTFTVAFAEAAFNEAALAKQTARTFNTNHDEFVLSGGEMLDRLGEAIGALDQPSIDGINTYFVSWAARQAGLKVALSGLGGDEMFGGYASTFRWTPRYERISALGNRTPRALRAATAAAMSSAGVGFGRGDAARKIAAVWNDSASLPHPYYFSRALFTPSQVDRLFPSDGSDNGGKAAWWQWLAEGVDQTREMDSFATVTSLEARSYLVNMLLRDTDSMSMAHSLEVRVPFLHHPLVEFLTQLPASIKLGNGEQKALLVAAVSDLVPKEIAQQKKRGFTLPWQVWLRGPLRDNVEASLSALSPALRDVLDAESVRAIWNDYMKGKTSWSRPWSLYVLNEWVKRHL